MSYTSQIAKLFSGISVTSTYPPHNGLAVGPNNIVMVEGSRIEWTDLNGGSPVLQSTYNFFASLTPNGGLYDQRVTYDSVNNRYVIIMEFGATGASAINIAVSKDSNPNDGWYFAKLNTSITINGQVTASDRPMLAIDGSNIYLAASQFNVSNSAYVGTEFWTIGDTSGTGGGIYNGGALTVTASELNPPAQGFGTVAAGDNGKVYYASDFSTGNQVNIALQTYDRATKSFGPTSTIALGTIDQGTDLNGAYTAQQKGTSLLLDAGDKRIGNIVYANGFLYGVSETKPLGTSVAAVHWFKIDVHNLNAPVLAAQGDITGATLGANVATFNGSIAVDAAGDVLINFTASGPNLYPSDYYAFQGGADPTGSFSAPILYEASTGFFNSGNGSSVQRWGINSSATVDPNNPNSFWISNEYVANNWWQTSVARVAIQNLGTAPTVTSVATSGSGITGGSGDLNAGNMITLTVNFNEAVLVNTTGGTPSLTLNDGGTATYAAGTGTGALTFGYGVLAGQNTPDLTVSSLNLNGATIKDAANIAANLSGAASNNPAGTLQIDTVPPAVSVIAASGPGITNGTGDLNAGKIVTLTVNFNEAVLVNTIGGTPTLTLNDGGIATYSGGSGTNALTFSHTVQPGQNTTDVAVSSFNLNGAIVKDGAANAADLSAASNYNPTGSMQIDTSAPIVLSIATSGSGITNGSGDLQAGKIVTLTVNFNEVVLVNTVGGSPMLTLNDGGIATFSGGSGSNALTFSHTVQPGQNTPDLTVISLNLNGGAVNDGATNTADLSGAANYNPAGTLQIDTTLPSASSIQTSGTGVSNGNGDLSSGKLVTFTVNFSAPVTVDTTGGTPVLALNDGDTANYTGGSGTSSLTFTYAVKAGQNTPDLLVSALNLNGATLKDALGDAADLSGAINYNPAGTLQVDTTPPIPLINQEPPTVTSNNAALFAFETSNAEANGVNFAYELDGATTWTAITGSSLSLSRLANGAHTINVQATDGAGNVSIAPATYNWTINSAAPHIETQFSGISITTTYPPNNALAVGPNNTVMVEGSRIEWTNLSGASPSLQSVYSFFSPLGAAADNSLSHPYAAYDSVNNRYVVVMDNSGAGHTISNLDIAVSKDSNPNDGWYFATLNTSLTINGQLTSADRPMVSIDSTNIYISEPQYNVSVSGSPGTELWAVSETGGVGGGLYNGGALTVSASQLAPSSQGVFSVAAGNNGKAYYASDYSTGNQMVVALETYDQATKTFGTSNIISLGNADQGGSYTVQQLGTAHLLDAGNNRMGNLVYSNGSLYGVAEMKPVGANVPDVHWFKIDVSNPNAPALAAQGDITGASIGANVATLNGSIAVDGSGDVIVNFTASGPNMFPADYYTVQKASDPAGSFSAPVLYQASTSFFDSGNGASIQPWGVNSTATTDPTDPNAFWISNEYVANGWWQTAVAKVAVETPPEVPLLAIANATLNVAAGGSTALGVAVTSTDTDDVVSVTIAGLTAYESVTDQLDHLTFSGGAVTLSAAQVNSGLTLNSTYTGTDHPVNTLTIAAYNAAAGETVTSAAQTITVTDPPAASTSPAVNAAHQIHDETGGNSKHHQEHTLASSAHLNSQSRGLAAHGTAHEVAPAVPVADDDCAAAFNRYIQCDSLEFKSSITRDDQSWAHMSSTALGSVHDFARIAWDDASFGHHLGGAILVALSPDAHHLTETEIKILANLHGHDFVF